MTVERYRTAEEMNAAPIRTVPGDAFERFVRHGARCRAIAPRAYPRGVFPFRTLEDAQRQRERVSVP